MKQFLETICIRDGVLQYLEWHQRRVEATIQHFYPGYRHPWTLSSCIDIPSEFQSGVVRCRIIYDGADLLSIQYFPYVPRIVERLKLIEAPSGFDYRYKYAERNVLASLYDQRGDAEDILITRDGWITDTSMANIAFQKNGKWYTPSIPLLAGTSWKRLVSSGRLMTCPIHWTQRTRYDTFRIFNSMNDLDTCVEQPTRNIIDLPG